MVSKLFSRIYLTTSLPEPIVPVRPITFITNYFLGLEYKSEPTIWRLNTFSKILFLESTNNLLGVMYHAFKYINIVFIFMYRTFQDVPEDVAQILSELEEKFRLDGIPNLTDPRYGKVMEDYASDMIRRGLPRNYMGNIISITLNNPRGLKSGEISMLGFLWDVFDSIYDGYRHS